MKRPPVVQIRRLALAAAVAMALVIAGSYGLRRWRAYQARRELPAAVPADVRQQTEKFTLSRSEEGRRLFLVEASRTTERAGQTTLLEDVVLHIYGHRGDRADEIRTGRCEYDVAGTGQILCPGRVRVYLGGGSAAEKPASHAIRLTTAGVQFDPARGVAWTDQPVQFSFPEGRGDAVGLRYQPTEPKVRLESRVTIRVTRGGGAPVEIRGSQLHYSAGAHVFELFSPLQVRTGDRILVADHLRMELDNNFRTQRIIATGQVRAQATHLTMQAARAVAIYADDGHIQQLRATGQVEFERRSEDSEETLTCGETVFHFDPDQRRIERIVATGGAQLVSQTAEERRTLQAPVLELVVDAGGRSEPVLTARQPGSLVLRRRSGEQRTVVANRIQLQFTEKQRLRRLTASGAVETKHTRPGAAERVTTSKELRARFDDEGKLIEAEQWERFRYQGRRWRAEAGRAQYRSDTETFVLREQPVLWDAATRTRARRIEVAETAGVLRAEGEVRTTRQPSADGPHGFGTGEPVQLAADRMRAEDERGWARYEGRARLWQGANRLAATAIELFRTPTKLVAEGDVSGLFLEAADEEGAAANPTARRRLVRIASDRLTYLEAERWGVFEGQVTARNDFGTLTAPRLEVFLNGGAGSERLDRVHALGGVVVEQAGRQASSEHAEYAAGPQTVVLWGGTPKIVDAQRGITRGARLTLFLVDGRILVESAEGIRTVTRRPWTQ
ncbi:MAG: LptA/OstA family protein [Terriglobia bacterium]